MYKIIYIYIIKKNVCEVLLALFCPVTTNSNVSFSMTMSKIIVIHPSTNMVLARCSAADVWCLSSSVFSGVISFFGHDSEIIHEWICGVSAYTLLQENRSTSFCYWRLRDMRCEPLVDMCCFCVRVCWLFWRYIWFLNSWRSLLNWGAAACVVLILEWHLVLFTSFWHCWSFQRCVSSNSWHGMWDLFILIAVYSYARRTDLFGESSEMELRFYDVILGMDWLSRHRVVLDCLRERVDIVGADGSFYCMHAKCSRVIWYKSR